MATAPALGFDVTVLLGAFFLCFHVARDTGKLSEVAINNLLRLSPANGAEALGETERGDAVRDAKINHLRCAALVAGHFPGHDVKDLRGGSGMDVLAFLERGQQTDVARQGRKDAQLNLRIVGCE